MAYATGDVEMSRKAHTESDPSLEQHKSSGDLVKSVVFGGLDGASGVELTFDDFAALVEEALAECGFEARKRWKKGVAKLAGIRKLSALARMNVG